MSILTLRPADQCRYDEISMGEVMLRLCLGEGRIKTTRSFRASEGGGEYNVARGLRRCFGLRAGVISAFAENEVGTLGARWFHTGGIFAALSESTVETVIAATEAAHRHGVIVSYDLNYRPSLLESDWRQGKGSGRQQAHREERRCHDRK
jgi:sugar/nucleoside kinase (ribokinase family)